MALQIEVGADIKQAVEGLKALSRELGATSDSLNQVPKSGAAAAQSISSFNKTVQSSRPGLANLQDKVQTLGETFHKTGRSVAGIDAPMKKAADGIKNVGNASGAATRSVIDLSRIIQDSPYGFIGIANNLNPAIEGLQRLTKEAGGVGGAMRALGSSLVGPGGVGIALSTFQFFALGGDKVLRDFAKSMFSAGKVTADTAKVFQDASSAAGEQTVKLNEYKRILTDLNVPQAERVRIAQEYNAVADKTNEIDLKQINNLDLINKKIQEQTKLIMQRALASAALSQLTEFSNEYIKAQLEFEKALEGSGLSLEQFTAQLKAEGKSQRQGLQSIRNNLDGFNKRGPVDLSAPVNLTPDAIKKRFEEAGQGIQKGTVIVDNNLKLLYGKMQGTKSKFEDLSEDLRKFITVPGLTTQQVQDDKGPKVKTTKSEFLFQFLGFDPNGNLNAENRAKLVEVIDKFSTEFGGLLQGANFYEGVRDQDGAIEAAKKFWKDFQNGIIQFKPQRFEVDGTFVPRISTDGGKGIVDLFNSNFKNQEVLSPIDVPQTRERILEDFKTLFAQVGQKLPGVVSLQDAVTGLSKEVNVSSVFNTGELVKGLAASLGEVKRQIDAFQTSVRERIVSLKADIFSTVAEGLGNALSGGNFSDMFASIFNIMGSFLQTVGKELIVTSIAIQKVKIALAGLFKNPLVGLAVGAGLIGIGAAMKNSFAKIKPFKDGGMVFGPTLSLIGEGRGTTRSNPEVVAPLDKLKNYIGGNNNAGPIIGEFEIRGRDLALVLARQEGFDSRNG